MDGRKRLVFLLEDLCFGGTQKQNLELALLLDKNKYDITLLTLTGPTDLDEQCKGLNLRHLGNTRKVDPFFLLRLPKVLKEIRPDILVPCTALPNIWGRIWGKLLHIPVIVGTCRGGGAPMRQHERFLWRLSHHIVCNSRASLEAMQKKGVPADHLTLIANGIDPDYFTPKPDDREKPPLILCVARLAEDKDHKTLLDAFNLVCQKNPDVRLRIVGEGPEEKALKEYAANALSADVQVRVEFAGASANPLPHYQDASIFALSSIREGQPNVLLEAMSCQLPVCATEAGGIPQLVEKGKTGLLSPIKKAEAFAENLLFLLNNPTMAMDMGKLAREKVKAGYSFSSMVNAHDQLFEKLWENYVSIQKPAA